MRPRAADVFGLALRLRYGGKALKYGSAAALASQPEYAERGRHRGNTSPAKTQAVRNLFCKVKETKGKRKFTEETEI